MSLSNPMEYLKLAQKNRVAIAAFNVHNMETIQAVAEGAAEENAPVIIQTTPGTLKHAGVGYIEANVRQAAALFNVPLALHVDHCSSFGTIIQCLRHGYTSLMIDAARLPFAENVALVKKVVEIAHCVEIPVEGELGRIGGVEEQLAVDEREATFTVPEEAETFVALTGIDSLAVAIGTAHGEYKGEPKLDFERLSAIRARVKIPLVLHGASGVPDAAVREAIRRGICKVNIATELKIPMARAIQECFQKNSRENDPRHYLGSAKEAVKKVVRAKIRLCGASNLADELRRLNCF